MLKRSLLGVLVVFSLAGCSLCDLEVRTRAKSPNGRYVATAYEKNCGATVAYLTEVTIEPVWGLTAPVRLIQVEQKQRIDLQWVNNGQLVVRCRTCTGRFVSSVNRWQGVTVQYRKD